MLCRRVRAPACVDGRRVCARDFLRPDVMSASTAPPVLLCSALHRSSLSSSLLLHAPSAHVLHDLHTNTHRTSTHVVRPEPEPAPARQVSRRRHRGQSPHTDVSRIHPLPCFTRRASRLVTRLLFFFCGCSVGPPAAARVRAPAGRGHSRAIELVYELEDEQTSALAPLRGLVGSSGRRRSVKDGCEEALDDAVFCSRDRCDWRATADVSEMLRCQCSCTLMESMHRRMVSENLFCIHIHFFSRQCESRTIGGDECPCTLTPPRWADPTQAQLALYMA